MTPPITARRSLSARECADLFGYSLRQWHRYWRLPSNQDLRDAAWRPDTGGPRGGDWRFYEDAVHKHIRGCE